jgi:small subunit ribosomal protein S21
MFYRDEITASRQTGRNSEVKGTFSRLGGYATTRSWENAVLVDVREFLARQPWSGERMPLRMRVHEREPIGLALRRFKKLLERSGIQKELRKRKYYEKPCEARRRAELRKQSAIRKARNGGPRKP